MENILLDCGSGALRTLETLGRPWQDVTQIVISHFHTDHVADLAPLLFALKHGIVPARTLPLRILGPHGLSAHMSALTEAFGDFVLKPGFPLEIHEIHQGEVWSSPGGSFTVKSQATPHTASSLAYRLESGDGVMGYTGDTGPDVSLGGFFEGCDVLVAECSNPVDGKALNHLTPATLAEIAGKAKPGLLISVHAYPPLDPMAVPDLVRNSGYPGWVLAGRDGVSVTFRSREITVLEPPA